MDDLQPKPYAGFTNDGAGNDAATLVKDKEPEERDGDAVADDAVGVADPAAATDGDDTRDDEEKAELDVDQLTSDGVPFAGDGEERKSEAPAAEDTGTAQPSADLSDDNKVKVALKVLRNVEQQVRNAIHLLEEGRPAEATIALVGVMPAPKEAHHSHEVPTVGKSVEGRVVEGVFDGQAMVGADGKTYSVPPNYASKSKLVEGDMLKLTITPKGSFIYKQIGPIDRNRLMGVLGYDGSIGQYYAASENRRWSVLRASVTYFKGDAGDEVVMLVPKHSSSKWAAVENIIKKNPLE